MSPEIDFTEASKRENRFWLFSHFRVKIWTYVAFGEKISLIFQMSYCGSLWEGLLVNTQKKIPSKLRIEIKFSRPEIAYWVKK